MQITADRATWSPCQCVPTENKLLLFPHTTTALCPTPHPGATVYMLKMPDLWFSMCSHALDPGAAIAPCMDASQTLALHLFFSCPYHESPSVILALHVLASHNPGLWPFHIYIHNESWPHGHSTTDPVSQPPHISHIPVPSVTTALYFPIPQTLALWSLCTCSAPDNGVTISSCASVPQNCHHHKYTCDPDTYTTISLSTPAFWIHTNIVGPHPGTLC